MYYLIKASIATAVTFVGILFLAKLKWKNWDFLENDDEYIGENLDKELKEKIKRDEYLSNKSFKVYNDRYQN